MSAFDKLGMVAALVTALLTACVEASAATTAIFSPVVSTAGDLSSLPHQSSRIDQTKQALQLATFELALARKLTNIADDLCFDPAFLAYLHNLKPVLDTAETIKTLDPQPVFALAYGLAGARSSLETDVASLHNWLLIHQIVSPDEQLISPPARFVAVSTEPLLDEADELSFSDLAPDIGN